MNTRLLTACVAILPLWACAPMGPSTISASRPAYNLAIQHSNDQELLLNLVRILYRDTTYFTTVERIAASYEFNRSVTGSIGWEATADAITRSLNLKDATFALNEQPTVFYAPLDGERFARQMLSPMNPDLLLLLVKSGWSLDRVFSVGVQEMNGLRNAPSAAGPTPALEPIFREFKETVRLLRSLQSNGLIEMGKSQDSDGIEVRFAAGATSSDEVRRIRQLLSLAPDRDRFKVIPGSDSSDPSVIAISTRPLISALSYLAQGIEAPQADLAAGKIRNTQRRGGGDFDWQELLDGVFKVKNSDKPPTNASIAVQYRGNYFYIADDDLDSKSTFVLVNQLMALSASGANTPGAINFTFGK